MEMYVVSSQCMRIPMHQHIPMPFRMEEIIYETTYLFSL